MERTNRTPGQYLGVVFKHAPPTADFSCSSDIVLPGLHTAEGAWQAVYAALGGPQGAELVGGEIRPA